MCKAMGKIWMLLATALLLGGCGKAAPESLLGEGESDTAYIQEKGTLLVGVTEFAPMDFREDGQWSGFDARLASDFARELGVTPEFVEIDWDKKEELLEDGTIDCVWNGMTMTEELRQKIDCSSPYLSNAQVIVMSDKNIGNYGSQEECQHLLFAVEAGSTGEELLNQMKYRYTAYNTQKEALQSVVDGRADAAVIDINMAGYYTAEGKEFDSLAFDFPLNDEKICVGLRKSSDLTQKVDAFLEKNMSDGTMEELAQQYGIAEAVLR